jgi:hypothetical protein
MTSLAITDYSLALTSCQASNQAVAYCWHSPASACLVWLYSLGTDRIEDGADRIKNIASYQLAGRCVATARMFTSRSLATAV